ncbi:phosphorylase [Capsulimonas corticalis]|uniref:Uridine phosphorylase n=1 Tax=Capsulimonas corticalis TaxID=2219043 RepID=A0A402CSL0_9BACT|nr:nucleoside phosphorylase [Capsulimonas corticalis]BDI31049.1 phosphorylase [Capsulimonas corticalis]
MLEENYPILEFDPTPIAVIEPKRIYATRDVPEHAVVCFFQEVIATLRDEHGAVVLHTLGSEIGPHPVYEIEFQGRRLAVFHPGVGAPLAAALLDEVIAMGCVKFIACGGCGVLDSAIAMGHVLVPHAAVRDEGTSYHYLPPSREVSASPAAVAAIEQTLRAHGTDYLAAKTWTTDAIYRETPARVKRRRDEGCVSVEMEAAAFFAVAQFRGVEFGQLLYGGDDVGGEVWDNRGWQNHGTAREKLFWLAAEACLSL